MGSATGGQNIDLNTQYRELDPESVTAEAVPENPGSVRLTIGSHEFALPAHALINMVGMAAFGRGKQNLKTWIEYSRNFK